MTAKDRAQALLLHAGITIDGTSFQDVRVHDERVYDRVFAGGTLALGESYMDGWWDCDDIANLFFSVLRNDSAGFIGRKGLLWQSIKSRVWNLQSKKRAFQVGEQHYDIGNDLYERMLDKRMIYSCGYWKKARNLDEAQEHKLDLICRKIGLRKGDRVLDVGCGWGGFAKYAAEEYGATVVGITISHEQVTLAEQHTKGLPVEIRLQDWRDLGNEQFTHIVSVGMFEHVGQKNYREFMQKMNSILSDDGLFLLHTIGYRKTAKADPWYDKYIFPNGVLPSMAQIVQAVNGHPFGQPLFIIEDWHNFGADYDKTLLEWYANIERAWVDLPQYDERFRRMWRYYLLWSAAFFRARHAHLWQVVLSKKGVLGGYESVR